MGQWGSCQIYFTGGVPYYQQIARYFRKQMVAGVYLHGNRLPPSRQLARHLGVHYNTVLKAYRQLRNQGLIRISERIRGWIERKRPPRWLIEVLEERMGYEIKASLRTLLVHNVSIPVVAQSVGVLEKQAFGAARKSPEEWLRRFNAKLRKKWPQFS